MGGRGKAAEIKPNEDVQVILVDTHKAGTRRYRLQGFVVDGTFQPFTDAKAERAYRDDGALSGATFTSPETAQRFGAKKLGREPGVAVFRTSEEFKASYAPEQTAVAIEDRRLRVQRAYQSKRNLGPKGRES